MNCQAVKFYENFSKFFFIENNNSDTEFYLRFVLVYITIHDKLKLLVFKNCVKWVSPEWNSYQTVLRNRSQLIFKNKGEVWFFLFFYCENTFSVTNTHFPPDKKSFKWVPHTALIWHWKTPLGECELIDNIVETRGVPQGAGPSSIVDGKHSVDRALGPNVSI